MRGVRRLGALFLCVASLVAALEGDDLINSMINKGFTAEGGRDGKPQVFVKMLGMASEFTLGSEFTVEDMSENIAFARQWLSAVTSLWRGRAGSVER